MKEYIEANKHSWATIAQEHYQTFKKTLSINESTLSQTQIQELGDIKDKLLLQNSAQKWEILRLRVG